MEKKGLSLLPTNCRQAVIALVDGDGATGCAALLVFSLVTFGSRGQCIGRASEISNSKGVVVTRGGAASVNVGECAISGVICPPFLLFQLKIEQSGHRLGAAALANVLLIAGKSDGAEDGNDRHYDQGFHEGETEQFGSQIHRNNSLKYPLEISEYHDSSIERTAAGYVEKVLAHP